MGNSHARFFLRQVHFFVLRGNYVIVWLDWLDQVSKKSMKTISTFEAKNKLSEVIASAERGEPQIITKNGRKSAVVISYQEFERLTAKKVPLVEFLLDNPSRTNDIEIDTARDKTVSDERIDFNGDDFL